MTRRLLILLTVFLSASVLQLRAQSPAATPQFEVASVKPNKSGEPFIRIQGPPGGGINANNVPFRELIRIAYGVQDFQIEGLPSWASDRFDIVAKGSGDTTPMGPPVPGGPPSQMQLMMRHLLADRFKLVARSEKREAPIYALVTARADGRTGPQLTPSTTDCAALFAQARRGGGPPPSTPGQRPPCGMMRGLGSFNGAAVTMAQLAGLLSDAVRRPVVDKTGLSGGFDFELRFTPDQLPQGGPPAPGLPAPPPIDPNGPTLFTALQEQLGLKLENARGPVEVLVIERAEPPTPD